MYWSLVLWELHFLGICDRFLTIENILVLPKSFHLASHVAVDSWAFTTSRNTEGKKPYYGIRITALPVIRAYTVLRALYYG